MRPILAVAMLLSIALAGCADSGSPTTESGAGPGGEGEQEVVGLAMPEWEVGRWWQYETSTGNTVTLVVSEDRGSDWFIESDDEDTAFFEAEFGPISYLGDTRKTDLAGSQGTDRVEFFQWPLVDGAAWETNWDGQTMSVLATEQSPTRFQIAASLDGQLLTEYVYDDGAGWFDEITFWDTAGNVVFGMELQDSGRQFAGEIVRAVVSSVISEAGIGPHAAANTLAIPASTDADLFLLSAFSCLSIVATIGEPLVFAIGPAENIPGAAGEAFSINDDGYNFVANCPVNNQFGGVIGEFPNDGNWGYVIEIPADANYFFTLYLREFERFTL